MGLDADQSAYIKICKAKRAWLNKLWEIVNKRKLTKKRKKGIVTRATTVLPSLTTDQITAMLDGDKKQWDDFIKDNLKIG